MRAEKENKMKTICSNEREMINRIYKLANKHNLTNGLRVIWNPITEQLNISIKGRHSSLTFFACANVNNSFLTFNTFVKIKEYVDIDMLNIINKFINDININILTEQYFQLNSN